MLPVRGAKQPRTQSSVDSSAQKWEVMWGTCTHARDPHILSRGAHGSELRHTGRRCPGCCTDQDEAASFPLIISSPRPITWDGHRLKSTHSPVPHRVCRSVVRSAYSSRCTDNPKGDGAVERQSGPGDRSLRWDWSGCSPGTGPTRHESRRLCQKRRQNRGGYFNFTPLTTEKCDVCLFVS